VSRAQKYRLLTTRASEIEPEVLQWLWAGRFPLSKLTIVMGNGGTGKSVVMHDLAARGSVGKPLPGEEEGEVFGTLFFAEEDGHEDTVIPRLDAMGADMTMIQVVDGAADVDDEAEIPNSVQLKRHGMAIRDFFMSEEASDVKLVVIDPITALLPGVDANKGSELRPVLMELADIADQAKVAVVIIAHCNKAAGLQAVHRGLGSVEFVNVARAAWMIGKDPHQPSRRLLLPLKNNLGPDGSGLAFELETHESGQPIVSWETKPIEDSADDVFSGRSQEEGGRIKEARLWLQEMLADAPMLSVEIKAAAMAEEISWATLRRASTQLGVVKRKLSEDGKFQWLLPSPGGS